MRASGPAAAARPVEAGLGPARDGWPPTSALALLVKMAAVSIAATVVQSLSAQASGMSLPRFDPAAKSCSLEPRPTPPSRLQLLSSPEDWRLICCLPADAAGEPGGPLHYKDVLTRCPPAIFYPHDSEHECDRTIGHIRGILWVVQSIDLWLVSQPHFEGAIKYSDRHLAGLSARPPDRVELNGAGSLGYGTGPSFG
ncbi:hypothetical protein EMIHUDRAFT_234972 [Emiliania huxleyi CCMP1516]|uniref:Uncharacterized protein n=2 Tax=Emiliania huxleyi TaxID=2903 RepID=A0A0D3JXI1_EMIH1|nr:hypothetical protein EMIHUDRAFT_234972 [Emiliania huxleyi CCMP1516]EOD28216.1 hypothetical protein EMIHUDRAFT_234972 [Emiliania huxleyi CCMP1516]|eukprot:XP_005780645.1 hypothetical protein EMIHUDRAFT_234972 [Emiliania huxleyi CCMP1516]